MKRLRHLLFLIVLLLFLSACSTSAGSTETTIPSDTTETPDTTAPAPAPLTLTDGGRTAYTVIRGESASDKEVKAATTLRQHLSNLSGADLGISSDWTKDKGVYPADACEILVGRTEHPEMVELLSTLGYGDYAIRVAGNRILIAAWDASALMTAINEFTSDIGTAKPADGRITIPADYSRSGVVNRILAPIPPCESKLTEIIDGGDNSYMAYFDLSSAEHFQAYRQKMLDAGFTLYTERDVKGNLFATFTGHERVVNVYYNRNNRDLRIIAEPDTVGLPPRAEDTDLTANSVTPSVSLIGQAHPFSNGEICHIGLCMIFVLPDGRLIVVDGGHNFERVPDTVYKAMLQIAPDPDNITVAAWFLTHAHADHTAAFLHFARNHADDVRVERIVCNFTTTDQYDLINDAAQVAEVRQTIRTRFPDTEFIKAHNGQLFHFGPATVEMLYTIEDYRPENLNWHNTTSLVFRVAMAGQTIMVTGDATHATARAAVDMYSSYLDADFVQLAHHGSPGTIANFYNYIKGEVLLWPGSWQQYLDTRKDEYNVAALNRARDVYLAKDVITTIPLPYTIQDNKASLSK